MKEIIWLFPVIFMFHEMEEIIGFRFWLRENKAMLCEKYPKIAKEYEYHSTEGFALAVFEEYILCLLISAVAVCSGWYGLWFGGFIAYGIHLIIHIGQLIVIRKYIPVLATSLLTLPISVYFIIKSNGYLMYSVSQIIIYSIIGMVVIGSNLKLIHILMNKFTLKMNG